MVKVYLNEIPIITLLDRESPYDLIHPDIAAKVGITKEDKSILLFGF